MATSIKLMKHSLRPALCLTTRSSATYLLPRIFSNQFHSYNHGAGGDRNNRNSSFPDSFQRRQEKSHSRPDFYRDLGKEGEVKQPSMTIYGGKTGPGSADSKKGPGVDYGSQRSKDETRKGQQSENRSAQQSSSNPGASNISSGGNKSTDVGGTSNTSNTSMGGSTSKTSTDSHHGSRGHKSSHKSNLGNQTSSSGQEQDVSNLSMKGTAESNRTSQKDQTATSSNQGGIGAAADVMNRQSTNDHKHRQYTRKTGHHPQSEHTQTENDQTSRPPSDMSDTVHRDPTQESGLKTAFAADSSSKKAAEDKSAVVGDTKIDPTDTDFVQANPGNRAGTPLSSSNDDDYARSLKSGVKDNSYKVGMGNSGEANVKRPKPDGVSRPDDTVTREMAKGSENSGLEPGRSTGVGSNENITTKDIYTDHQK